jgi:ABC-type Mn2+/Zn2+ transport system ATPase subunit
MYEIKLNDPHFLPHCGCSIELTLNRGEVVVISGPNGLGKTTFINRIYESFKLNSDEVTLIEQRVLDFFYDRKLSEVKSIISSLENDTIDVSFFHQLWNSFGLDSKVDRLLSTLSGGEAQSLKLCVGLAKKAGLYLLDEPTQSLDHEKKSTLSEILEELRSRNKRIVIIEHDLKWMPQGWRVLPFILVDNIMSKGNEWNI